MPLKSRKRRGDLKRRVGAGTRFKSESEEVKNRRYSVKTPKEPKVKDVHSGGDSYHILNHQALIDALKQAHKSGGCNTELQVYHHVDISSYKLSLKCTPCKFQHDIVNPINLKGMDDITTRLVLGCLPRVLS